MPPRKKLAAVTEADVAAAQQEAETPKTILQASEISRLEELRAMRRRIAKALDDPNTAARDLASLSRRQIEIGRDIEAIEIDDEAWDGTGY